MTRDEMEEVKRHFGVVTDALRSDIRLVAEGHAVLDQKFDAVRLEVSALRQGQGGLAQKVDAVRLEVSELRQGHVALDQKLAETHEELSEFRQEFLNFRKDVQTEFRELRSLIKLSYAELDERMKNVERELLLLKSRLDDIEGRRA